MPAGKDFLASAEPGQQAGGGGIRRAVAARRARPDSVFQFERHGYFATDAKDHAAGKPVFNRITGLKDSWGK